MQVPSTWKWRLGSLSQAPSDGLKICGSEPLHRQQFNMRQFYLVLLHSVAPRKAAAVCVCVSPQT